MVSKKNVVRIFLVISILFYSIGVIALLESVYLSNIIVVELSSGGHSEFIYFTPMAQIGIIGFVMILLTILNFIPIHKPLEKKRWQLFIGILSIVIAITVYLIIPVFTFYYITITGIIQFVSIGVATLITGAALGIISYLIAKRG